MLNIKLDTKSLIMFLKEHRYKYFDVSLIVSGVLWDEDEFISAYAGKYWIINE